MIFTPHISWGTQSDQITVLRNIVTVEDNVIRLKDLFENAGPHAERVIARSPEPGNRILLPAKWLWRTAQSLGLHWRPSSDLDTAQVTRASNIIDSADIEDAIREALVQKYKELETSKWDINVDSRARNIHLPIDIDHDIHISQIRLNRSNNSFSAVAKIGYGTRFERERRLRGKIYRLIDIWVPNKSISLGSIINEKDLMLTSILQEQLPSNSITDLSSIIGMQTKRTLNSNQPIRQGDLQKERIILKGEKVTVFLKQNTMLLSISATAMEDGIRNHSIRVRNNQSNRVIEAKAIGPGIASIDLGQNLATLQ